jgi:hypothetical protein
MTIAHSTFCSLSYNTLNTISFITGPQLDPSNLPKRTPFNTVGDYENYIQRLELYPNQVRRIIFNIATGTIPNPGVLSKIHRRSFVFVLTIIFATVVIAHLED